MAGTPAHLNTSVPENGGAPTVTAEEAAVSINADESPVLQRSLCTAQLNRPVQDGHLALEPSTRQSPRKTRGSCKYVKWVSSVLKVWGRLNTAIEQHKLQRQFAQTLERKAKFDASFLLEFCIGPMKRLTALVESIPTGELLWETDPRVQQIMQHVAVLSEPQIKSLRETVKRIGNCGRLEVAPGSKDATWLLAQIQCCVACASVTAGSVPAPFKGGWSVPSAEDIGGYDLHQNTGGTGYDKSSHAGWTEVWELAAPDVKEITRSQEIGVRFSLHGFIRGGEFGSHKDKDNARWLVCESQGESKLIFKADGQEVIYHTIAVSWRSTMT